MKNHSMKKHFRQSFTLIELVVAMAVFSLMMMMMMQFFSGTQDLWSKTDAKNNMYADARVAMDLISSALQSVYYEESSASDFKGFFFRAAAYSESASPRMTFPVKLSRESPFYTETLSGSDGGFAKAFYLSFFLENDTNADGNTVKLLKVANDGGSTAFTADTTAAPASPATDKETVIGNIVSLNFRMFRSNFSTINNSGEYTGKEFPRAVEIKLKMMPKNAYDTWAAMAAGDPKNTFQAENEFEFVRVVYLGAY